MHLFKGINVQIHHRRPNNLLFKANSLANACAGEMPTTLLGRLSLFQEELGSCENAEERT